MTTAEPEVRVLEAGAEPRTLLRPLPEVAGLEKRELSLTITGQQLQGQMNGQTAAPPILLELELERGAPEGHEVRVEFRGGPFALGDTELIDPKVVLAMQAALDGTAGFAGSFRTDRSQALLDFQFEQPDADNPQAQQLAASYAQTLAQLAVRFPAEPVGVGARWSWTSEHLLTLGARIEQRVTATLEPSAQGLRIIMESSFDAERQRLAGPPLPDGASLDVTSITGTGSASLAFIAGELLPVSATAQGHWDVRLISDRGGAADEVILIQDMKLTLELP